MKDEIISLYDEILCYQFTKHKAHIPYQHWQYALIQNCTSKTEIQWNLFCQLFLLGPFTLSQHTTPQNILEATCCVLLQVVTMENVPINITDKIYMKPRSKIYMIQLQWNLYPFFSYASFSCKHHSFLLVPKNHQYEQCITVSGASFLKVLFYHINHSEFLFLTHNIPRMIVSEEKKGGKQHDIFGM